MMKNFMNKSKKTILSLMMALVLLTAGAGNVYAKSENAKSIRLEDDYFEYINSDWLKSAKIPEGESSTGATEELEAKIDKTLMEDFDKMSSGKIKVENDEMKNAIDLYKMVSDEENKENGIELLLPLLKEVESISSLKDLTKKSAELQLNNYTLPYSFGIGINESDSSKKTLYLSVGGFLLPGFEYYEDGDKEVEEYIKRYKNAMKDVFVDLGKTEKEATKMISNIFKIDKMMVENLATKGEDNNIVDNKETITFDKLKKYSKNIDFEQISKDLIGSKQDKVVVGDIKYVENFDKVLNQENLPLIKDWMYYKKVYTSGFMISNNSLTKLFNVDEPELAEAEVEAEVEVVNSKRRAYDIVTEYFPETVGNYYGKKYFGEEAKAEVSNMTKDIIKTYKERIKNNDWLSEKTKKEAVNKLEAIKVQIGYSGKENQIAKKIKVDSKENLFANLNKFDYLTNKEAFDNFNKPVVKDQFIMPGHIVNAAYDPSINTICFPAGILQAPFYSKDNTLSQNYGSIGSTIGHEISHAFDSSGALYDKDGNLKNWWTDEDFKKFEGRIEKVEKLFNGIEYAGGKVDGKLTLGENISDESGLRVALETLKSKDANANMKEFFSSWAASWRVKETPEMGLESLKDEHAPSKIRANLQLSNMEEFLNLYNIKEGDNMYLAPENRVSVW